MMKAAYDHNIAACTGTFESEIQVAVLLRYSAAPPGRAVPPPGGASNYYKYIAVLKENSDRQALRAALRERYGVHLAGEVYELPLHKQPVFSDYAQAPLPVAEDLCARHICLPVFSGMEAADADAVIFALEEGSPILRDGGRYGAFEQPEFRKAFDFYLSFYRQGFASPVSSSQVANLFQEFERGNIAMYLSGPWYIGEFKNRLDSATQKKWMTAPMPGINGPGVSTAGGSSLSLFSASKHKKVAWQLMEYLSRPSIQLEFYHLTGDLPPRKTAWQDTALANNK